MEKGITRLKVLVVILCVIVLALGGYFLYDKVLKDELITENETSNNTNNAITNENLDNSNQNQEENNSSNFDENDFIRETRVTLIDEPNCTGKGTPLIAAIESNGNISIAQNGGAVEIEVGNAKYIYRVGIIACDNFKLYYITDDMELYVIDKPNSTTLNQKATKVTESKVVEFLGEEGKSDGSYLRVLLQNGKVEYIKFFEFPN